MLVTYRSKVVRKPPGVDVAKICRRLMNIIEWQFDRRGVVMLPEAADHVERNLRAVVLEALVAADQAALQRVKARMEGRDLSKPVTVEDDLA